MKHIICLSAISSLLLTLSSNAFTFSLGVNFGGSTEFDTDASAYLVVNSTGSSTDTLTTMTDFAVDATGLSTGSIIGDYIVMQDDFTVTDFGGGALGFVAANAQYESTTFSDDIVAGTNLGIVIINGTDVLAYSGATTGDTNVAGDAGWVVPAIGGAGSLIDISTDLGGRVSLPDDLATIGSVIPEPSTALLSLAGLFSLITRRRRLI